MDSRLLLRDPLVAALPLLRKLKGRQIGLADLAKDGFILFRREGAPSVFDTIVGACRAEGFSPQVENEQNSMPTTLSLVEAEEGVAIAPASTGNLRSNGVHLFPLWPRVSLDLIAAWSAGEVPVVLRTFLDFLDRNSDAIRARAESGIRTVMSPRHSQQRA